MNKTRNPDPEENAARFKAAIEEFGAAMVEAVRLGARRGIASQIAEDFGPGPWVLYPDGRVETYVEPVAAPVTKIRPRKKPTPK